MSEFLNEEQLESVMEERHLEFANWKRYSDYHFCPYCGISLKRFKKK